MTEAPTKSEQLVTRYIAIWNDREFSKLSEVVAGSFTLTSPTAGTVQGRDTVEAHARAIVHGFSDYRITVNEMLAGENTVVSESTLSGTHDGEFDGIPPTQEEFEIRGMAKFVVEDGQLQEEHAYFDRYDLLSQLGLVAE